MENKFMQGRLYDDDIGQATTTETCSSFCGAAMYIFDCICLEWRIDFIRFAVNGCGGKDRQQSARA